MKQIVVPLCVFAVVTGLFFGMLATASAVPNVAPAYGKLCDGISGSWCIEPGKYVYRQAGGESVALTVYNLSDGPSTYDMGDGGTLVLDPYAQAEYIYRLELDGSHERPYQLYTYRYIIKKQTAEAMPCALVFKVEPQKKGGDL